MAIVSCKECGRNISDKAEFCPSCGATSKAAIPDPPKKSAPKKKWWEIEINRWKFATFIFAFFTVLFFLAYITHLNKTESKQSSNASNKSKVISFHKISSFSLVKTSPMKKRFERKLKLLEKYRNEIFNNSKLRYLQIVNIADFFQEYDSMLKSIKNKKEIVDNNKTVLDFIKWERDFQKKAFPRLRRFYAVALKRKFRGVDKSAAGGKRYKILAVKSHIFVRKKEVEKFHLLIEDILKKLRFDKVIYIDKKNKDYIYYISSKRDEAL